MFGIGRKKEDTEFETITPFTSTSSEKTDEGFETITPLTKVEPQKAPGLLEQTWRGVGRGVTKDIPEMLGAPFKFLGADEFGDAIGKSLEDYQPESKGGIVEQGVEGFVAFAPAMLTKALQIPTNIALSLDTYNKTKEEAEKAGVTNPGALAAFHGGATFATLMALGKFGESITNPAFKSILGKAAKKTPQEIISPTLGSAVKDIALHGALATGMFSAQTALGAVVDKETGFRPDADPLQDVKEMLGPMGVMMGLGAASGIGVRALHTRGANRMANILNDGNADPVQRGVIADSIGKYLEKSNPDAAKAWADFSANRIKNKENIPLDMNLSDKLDLAIESGIDKHESGGLLKTDTKQKKPLIATPKEEEGVLDNLNNLDKNIEEQKAKQEAKRKEAAAVDAPEFDVPSTVETKKTDLPVSFFKNQRGVKDVTVGENGELNIKYKNGLDLTVKSVDYISENEVNLKGALGRTNLKTGERITGSYKDLVVKLVKDKAGEFTWHHESAHLAEDMGLITKEERIVLQKKIQKLVKEGKLTTKSEDGTDIGGAEDRADYLAKIKLSGEEPTGTIKKIFTKMQEWVDRMVEGYKLKTGQAPSAKITERAFKTGRVFERRISNIEKMMKKEGAPSVLTDEFIEKATQQGIDFTDTIQKSNFTAERLMGLLDKKEQRDSKLNNLSRMGYASARKLLSMSEHYRKQLNDLGISDETIKQWRDELEAKESRGSLLGFNDVVNGVGGIKNSIHEANQKKVGTNFLGDSNNIVKAFNNMPGEIDKAYYAGKQMMEEGTPVKKTTGAMAKNRESAKKLRESVFEGRTESLADKGMMDTRLPKEQPSVEKDKETYHYNTNSPHRDKWEQYSFFKNRKDAYKLSEEDFILKAWYELESKYKEGDESLIAPPNYVGGEWVKYDLEEMHRESVKNSKDTSTQSIKDHKMSFKMPANYNLTGKDTTTLDLVKSGKRTGTTRSYPLGKVGDIITFEGQPEKYKITGVEQLTADKIKDPAWIKKWSEKEQWTPEAFKKLLEKGTTVKEGSWQTTFEKVEGIEKTDANKTSETIIKQLKSTPAFRNEAGFLSNFSPYKSGEEFVHEGIKYPSNEHFYQAMKFKDYSVKQKIAEHPANGLKAFVRTLGDIRSDWNSIKDSVMETGLKHKFSLPRYKELLKSTGSEELVERNNWGDKYWGQVDGVGQNKLGKMLMDIRDGKKIVESEIKGITFTESTGGYAERTRKNASADATIAIATDFTTPGEKLTKSAVESQGKKYIPVNGNVITVTQERVDNIVSALNSVNAKTLNIAGNGIYSLKGKYSQAQIDEFTKNLLQKVVESPKLKNKIEKIVTGGQTGFDEAGAKAAKELGIPVEVHAPRGWMFRDINGKDIHIGVDKNAKEKFMARFEGKAEERRTPVTSFKELPQRYKERYIKKYPGDTVAKNEYYGSMSDKELLQHIHDNPKDGDAINFRLRGMSNEKLDALRLAKPGNKWVEAEIDARKNPVPQRENPPQPRPEMLALQKDISKAAEDIAKLTKEKYSLKNKNWTVDKAKQLQALEWTFEQLREKYEREFTVSDMQRNKNAEVKGFEEKRARAVDWFNRDISGIKEELERQRQAQRKIDTKEKLGDKTETILDTAPEQGTIWSRMTDEKLKEYMNKYGVSEATKSIIKKELESRITTDEKGNEKRNVPKEMKGQNKEMPSVERAMPSTEREIYRATRDGEERLLKFLGGLPSKKRGIIEEMRVYETAYKNTVDAKDSLKRSVMTAIGRFKALKDAYLREGGNYTNVQSHVMRWKGAMTLSNHGNSNIAKQLVDKFKDPLEREGMRNWLECEGDMSYLKMAYDESVKKGTKYAEGYKAAMNLSPEAKEACGIIKGIYNEKLLDLIRLDMLEHGIDNYINNSWRSTAASEAMKNSFKDMNLDERKEFGSLHENPSFLYKRLFRTSLHGELNGFEHVSKDIGHSLVKYLTSMDEALASREMIKNMSMDKTSNGKKVFLISPDEPVKGAIDEKGKLNVDYRTMYNPKGYEDVTKLSKAIIKSQGINRADVGDINAYDYVYIDSPSLRNWKFLGTDVSGNPMVYKGSLWVHKEFAKHLKAILERSRIRSFKWEIAGKPYYPGEAALNLSQNLKGLLLSFSGFHQVQVGVHAVFHRVNPFKPLEIDLKDPDQKMLAEHGLNISDTKGLEYFSEGLTTGGGLVAKIPVLGQLFQKYATYLFKSYIPRLKMSMGVEAYNRNLKRYYQDGKGPMTKEQVAFLTAKQADAAFGELNYELMGRSKTTQDVLRLFLLAPDFLEARARFVGQALSPYGNPNVAKGIFNNEQFQAAIMTGTLGMWFGARIINAILNDGDMKFDKHFSVVTPKGMSLLGLDIGEREYALRSIPGDIEHLFKDPRSFAFFRVNPVFVKPFMEAIVGRDQFGRYRDSSQQLMDYISGFAPIPTQTKRGEWNAMESIMKSTGINVYRSRTSFEKKLLELKGHRASFSQTSDEKKRSDLINIFADKLGLAKTKADRDEIYTDVKNHIAGGKLFRKDLNTIKKYATEDRVERAIKQMQLEDVIKAWDDASDVEKKKYKSLFVKKVHNMQMNSPDRLKELMPDVKKIIQEK